MKLSETDEKVGEANMKESETVWNLYEIERNLYENIWN